MNCKEPLDTGVHNPDLLFNENCFASQGVGVLELCHFLITQMLLLQSVGCRSSLLQLLEGEASSRKTWHCFLNLSGVLLMKMSVLTSQTLLEKENQ